MNIKPHPQGMPTLDVFGVARGGSMGSEEPPPQSEKGPLKGPLECTKRSTRLHKKSMALDCTKRSTITVCVINDATVEELNKFFYPIS